jgi:hypothetical protein
MANKRVQATRNSSRLTLVVRYIFMKIQMDVKNYVWAAGRSFKI